MAKKMIKDWNMEEFGKIEVKRIGQINRVYVMRRFHATCISAYTGERNLSLQPLP